MQEDAAGRGESCQLRQRGGASSQLLQERGSCAPWMDTVGESPEYGVGAKRPMRGLPRSGLCVCVCARAHTRTRSVGGKTVPGVLRSTSLKIMGSRVMMEACKAHTCVECQGASTCTRQGCVCVCVCVCHTVAPHWPAERVQGYMEV